MRYIFSSIFTFLIAINVVGQPSKVDTVAIMILDKMSYVIGELHSASFTTNIKQDVIDREAGLVTYHKESDIIFDGPDKMLIRTSGEKGQRGFWYNGETMFFYSYDENNFVRFDALPTTLQTIDSIHNAFGIDFPASDFLYPTFTDDLLSTSDEVLYNGRKIIDGDEYFHIVAHGKKMTIQLWISTGAFYLPGKILIMDHDKNNGLQYEATLSNWKINEDYPNSIFDFLPPPGAHEIEILKRTSN